MLQATARRVHGEQFLPSYIVANARHSETISAQLSACGAPAEALILEPAGRNTAPAIALAAAFAAEADQDALLLVMPSDHVIADVEAFHRAVSAALPVAAEGWLVTFGIQPTAPETGYGYIETGEEIAPAVRRAVRFVEKPDRQTAEQYLASGRFSWNGGIFLFRADTILAALGERAPAIRDAAVSAIAGARRQGALVQPDPVAFGASPSESIDYAVMEQWDRVAVVPVDMGWSDIGSWDALHDFAADRSDTATHQGEVIAIDTDNCFIRSSGPLIAAVGLKDMIVVATDDAVMLSPRGRSQEVKRLVTELQRREHRALNRSTRSDAIWGSRRLLTEAGAMQVHEAIVKPGRTLAAFAEGKAEITVLSGTADSAGTPFQPGETIGPAAFGTLRVANRGDRPLHLLIRTGPA